MPRETASPAGWSVISAILLAAYKRNNHGVTIRSPISNEALESAGVLFVDDVDLMTMAESVDGPALHAEAQACTTDWSHCLNGSGGTLKGEKCFGYMVDYVWQADGSWLYSLVPDFDLKITLPDGSQESISLLDVDDARITLGIATRPNGDDTHHLRAEGSPRDKWKYIKTRVETWVNRLVNGRLPAKHAWVSYKLQLWAGVRYGLGVLAIPLAEFGELTKNFAYRVLPKLGVNRNIRTGWRYLHPAFSGCGLLDLSTESVISRLNMFLQHWDNPAPVGSALRASMECLQLEIGCRGCPLDEPYDHMGPHCTHSWVRSFWECVDKFKLRQEMWASYCLPDGSLPRGLGKWVDEGHKRWEWFFDPASDSLSQRTTDGWWVYHRTGDTASYRTRTSHLYARTGQSSALPVGALPVSISLLGQTVLCLTPGPPLSTSPASAATDFWVFLRGWKGSWMWEDAHLPAELSMIDKSIRNSSAIFVTDGSYNR